MGAPNLMFVDDAACQRCSPTDQNGGSSVWAEAQGAQQLPIGEQWQIQELEATDLAYPG